MIAHMIFGFLKMVLINEFPREEPTIETSVLGAEFVAMKNRLEA